MTPSCAAADRYYRSQQEMPQEVFFSLNDIVSIDSTRSHLLTRLSQAALSELSGIRRLLDITLLPRTIYIKIVYNQSS